jgi:hypothetical protein
MPDDLVLSTDSKLTSGFKELTDLSLYPDDSLRASELIQWTVAGETLSDIYGTLNQLFAGLGLLAIGNVDVIGILGKTLDAIVITANGSTIALGILDKTLGTITISAAGKAIVTGNLLGSLDELISEATGYETVNGILDELLADMIFDGTGMTRPIYGNLEAILQSFSLSGYGNLTAHIQEYRYRDGITMRSRGVWPKSIRVKVKHH